MFFLGCECTGICSSSSKECCPENNGHLFPYTRYGKLRVQVGVPIYECNKRCLCADDCFNKVVQKGGKVKLCIYRTDNGCGWGVRTLENIKKGTFVVEYVGEVITSETAEERGQKYGTKFFHSDFPLFIQIFFFCHIFIISFRDFFPKFFRDFLFYFFRYFFFQFCLIFYG